MLLAVRWRWAVPLAVLFIIVLHLKPSTLSSSRLLGTSTWRPYAYKPKVDPNRDPNRFKWSERKEHYPVSGYLPMPQPSQTRLPRVQHKFARETAIQRSIRNQRRADVKASMERCWSAYQRNAWLSDELAPISGTNKTTYGGWAATLVDSLDTLWIMDMKSEFQEAVDAVVHIDFTSTSMETINLFETTIRYMGGLLAAFDLSGDHRLLEKALELADMTYAAFDTPNRVPVPRWDFHAAAAGKQQVASNHTILAEIGSLSLEFTRLSQITRDPKWYDATARLTDMFDEQQHTSSLPGLWPAIINGETGDFGTGEHFSLGAFADSMYEYLPKNYALLGGSAQHAKMFDAAMETAIKYAFFRPMVQQTRFDMMVPGTVQVKDGKQTLQPELQHLACFVGGMLALGGRLLQHEEYVTLGRQVTNTCTWAYHHFQSGIMPERCHLIPCPDSNDDTCEWDEQRWHESVRNDTWDEEERKKAATVLIREQRFPPGVSEVSDRKYHLRPEAIESIFVLYRITGDVTLLDDAWSMWLAIQKHTTTLLANAAVEDVTVTSNPPKLDNMESFWTAETLKYFYLLFSEPDYISLDEWVFNTEAHPFKRPGTRSWLGIWG